MKKLLLLMSFVSCSALGAAGDRDSFNQNLGRNYSLCVNISGTKTCPVTVDGSNGSVTLGNTTGSSVTHIAQSAATTTFKLTTAATGSTDVFFDLFSANSGGQGKIRSVAGVDTGGTSVMDFITTKPDGTSALTARTPFQWHNGPTSLGNIAIDGGWALGISGGSSAHTINGTATFVNLPKVTNLFRSFQQTIGTESGSVVSTPTQSLTGVTVPRAGTYRVHYHARAFTTTVANNSCNFQVEIRKVASAGAFGSATQLSTPNGMLAGGNQTAFRPVCTASTEWVGSLAASDRIYATILNFDNPHNPGNVGGGSYGDNALLVEELIAP